MTEINILEGLTYSRSQHAKHLEVLACLSRIVVLCLGRRWGKTYTAGLKFLTKFMVKLQERAEAIEAGELEPWAGLGLPRQRARRQLEGVVQAVVVSPARKQLDEIRGNIESRLTASGAHIFLHPDRHLSFHERPAESWFVMGGAAGVIRYYVGSRVAQLVGSKTAILWLNECGELDDMIWRSVKPLLWEEAADVIAEGTPAFDESHWYTQLAVSGLPDGHERADRKIAPRNEDVTTYLGDSTEAYSARAREEAQRDLEASGPDDIYTRWQIKGDWRLPGMYVFGWKPDRHLATVTGSRGIWNIKPLGGSSTHRVTEQPIVMGGIDWFRGTAPAGGLVIAVWPQNPLSPLTKDGEPVDPRPLMIALDEMSTQKGEQYSDDAFIGRLVALQELWDVDVWYQDPFSPKLTTLAKGQGLAVADTDPAEKLGRLALLGRQLNCNEELEPALYVSLRCKAFADQLTRYRWARKRDGTPTGKPIQYNDWLIDGAAYVVPHTGAALTSGGPFG